MLVPAGLTSESTVEHALSEDNDIPWLTFQRHARHLRAGDTEGHLAVVTLLSTWHAHALLSPIQHLEVLGEGAEVGAGNHSEAACLFVQRIEIEGDFDRLEEMRRSAIIVIVVQVDAVPLGIPDVEVSLCSDKKSGPSSDSPMP